MMVRTKLDQASPESLLQTSRVKGTLFGRSFWARWYCVSTVGSDESAIRQYIQHQEQHQKEQEQDDLNVTQWPLLGAFLIPPALSVVDDWEIPGIVTLGACKSDSVKCRWVIAV